MIRSLLRMLKHITLAVLAIVCAVCVAEVGLRGFNLYQQCDETGNCELAPRPCPIAFHRLPPLQQVTHADRHSGRQIVIRINRLGLRGADVPVPKAPDVIRVVCLGDEATFAADIAEELTFAALVQQTLSQQSGSPVEVVNAGIPGYCPLLALAWARQQLVALQPDLVVLCCDRSDVLDDRRLRPFARYAADGTLESVCHPMVAQRSQNLMQAIEQEFQLAAVLRRQLSSTLGNGPVLEDLSAVWSETDATTDSDALQIRQTWRPIKALRDLCDQISSDFVVAIIPSHSEQGRSSGSQDWTLDLLAKATEEAGVPYLDVTADFPHEANPQLFSERTGALSPEGHRLFADLLSWAILRRSGETGLAAESASIVTPASATLPSQVTLPQSSPTESVTPTDVPAARPSPLPTLRRPRAEEEPAWVQ